ncbi:putative nucleoside-diphosphate-sugar epimerase [Aspergillus japonicus CBS 114.51]|uniref:Putative nucleoside-diphosphate-sugar epimerase n=1 Tax=Aspergillus japonicus CBS 114.51 TaxID=1448312 RepID=A0A8T8WYS6_ASPJA|nr:putative nucleoside-diphosphate-sugar epimerase [Aspergillus japonicus CBS 114.51]RAH80800.1 putative nucleoside-diphosphate-sugar epimerase [Aspergillus japonicus CBS 114.51]
MKIILAGATGFIGQEILTQCLAHPSITSILVLSRRELPDNTMHPKLHVHHMQDQDFVSYSDPQLAASLHGAAACIWTLGVSPSRVSADKEAFRRVTLEYTRQAAKAFNEAFTASLTGAEREEGPSATRPRFRFVYFSGRMAERDQTKSLWVMAGYRRLRGQAENIFLEYAAEHPASFESYIMRPGMVLSRQGTLVDRIRSLAPSVRVDVLARAAVDLAVQGHSEKIWENARIAELGGVGGQES